MLNSKVSNRWFRLMQQVISHLPSQLLQIHPEGGDCTVI